ncbi:MAG: biotin--[acetyl-CoA-carboxylase] ligase [Gammaproteobacteria bacterium]|nr:biotin--[acetyl-CoA-carboxylase] ligase [Gammaproteobacteria bacterium]
MTSETTLESILEQLARTRSAVVARVATSVREDLARLGVEIDGDAAKLPEDVELLDADRIRSGLSAQVLQWLADLTIYPHIGSTNTELMTLAERGAIDGRVLLAEAQTAGRGRRGRTWMSPFARNLAVTLGVRIRRPVAELGSLSLIVGVAVADALERLGVSGVQLKWPNDVLLDGRKLCGILIELPRATEPVEVAIGIGVNVGGLHTVRANVEQGVADVTEQVTGASRNELASLVIEEVWRVCRAFEVQGFAAFKARWQTLHRYHGHTVDIVIADQRVSGTVIGVDDAGALRLQTTSGVRTFNGGEVSLRG